MSMEGTPEQLVRLLIRLNEEGRTALVDQVRKGADLATLQQGGHLDGLPLPDLEELTALLLPGRQQQQR